MGAVHTRRASEALLTSSTKASHWFSPESHDLLQRALLLPPGTERRPGLIHEQANTVRGIFLILFPADIPSNVQAHIYNARFIPVFIVVGKKYSILIKKEKKTVSE